MRIMPASPTVGLVRVTEADAFQGSVERLCAPRIRYSTTTALVEKADAYHACV